MKVLKVVPAVSVDLAVAFPICTSRATAVRCSSASATVFIQCRCRSPLQAQQQEQGPQRQQQKPEQAPVVKRRDGGASISTYAFASIDRRSGPRCSTTAGAR